jgi:hypothetical protein
VLTFHPALPMRAVLVAAVAATLALLALANLSTSAPPVVRADMKPSVHALLSLSQANSFAYGGSARLTAPRSVLMQVETLGEASAAGWQVHARCRSARANDVPWVRHRRPRGSRRRGRAKKPAGWLLWRSWPLKRSPLDRDRMIDHS